MDLNPNQKLAVETLDRDLSISAGAGSGKTRVLVERFCRIVREGSADVDQVLTVTFTEKAAKEMKERMVKRFNELFAKTDEKRFQTAARRIETAYIGTIHSFAARVLRENAFEARVDPKFGVLTAVEAEILQDKVIEELFVANQMGDDRVYIDMLWAFGRGTLAATVKKFHRQLCTLGREAADIPAASATPDSKAGRALETFTGLIDALMAERRAGNLTGKLVEQLDNFAPEYPALKVAMSAACARLETSAGADYTDAFDWARHEELGRAEKFVGNVGAKAVREELIAPAKAAAKTFLRCLLAPIAGYYVECLKQITADFNIAYDQAKRRPGLLDFDDLLLKARDLFTGPDGRLSRTAAEYRAHFKFVMVDEFQDTNALQLSLIEAVCPPGRFFTVGDAKQSIYSFMHSDISVFQKHHQAIEGRGGRAIPLVENYRSRGELIDFINSFFAELWREDADFDFEALQARGDFQARPGPNVELLIAEPGANAEESRRAEARAIARRINELQGQGRQAGDIVVLFSATTNIKLYERALTEAGIDFYVVSGRGFYATHEVGDVIDLLKVVDNPLDDIAMAAVLRSPIVRVSDDALWWLTRDLPEAAPGAATDPYAAGRRRGMGKIYAGLLSLEGLSQLSETDRPRLVDWRRTLERLHAVRSESRITRLIDMALKATDCDLKLLASPGGRQKYANIRKLTAEAEAFGARSLFALPDFIRHIEEMVTLADREVEAPTETETSPVVRLMTIHKAKGLEAPVIFVADCSRQIKSGDSDAFIMDKDLGLAAKVKSPLTEKMLSPAAYEAVAARLKQKDIEESKRLLYVAATRAQELLVFSGSSSLDGKALEKSCYTEVNSWMGWLERAFGLCDGRDEEEVLLSLGGAAVNLRCVVEPAAGAATETSAGRSKLGNAAQSPGCKADEARGEGAYVLLRDRTEGEENAADGVFGRVFSPLPGGESPLTLGVTQIIDFFTCPEKYRLKWVLGLEEPLAGPAPAADNRHRAAAVGSAVHEVLASVDFKGDAGDQVKEYVRLQDPALQPDIRRYCGTLLDSAWPARLAESERVFQEVPFNIALPGCRLTGRIDLLFKESAGWIIADYKTGGANDQERYGTQIKLYALALEKSLGVVPAEVALISLGKGSDYSAPVDLAGLDDIRGLIETAAGRIARGEFTHQTSDACAHCGYNQGFCRY
ncbi:MAG: UvrD-helicase domain-containing protein [Actinomycetota bacterium]|nr:UvrD-helicase domain-containing protein [Actinomycetota bacterium]